MEKKKDMKTIKSLKRYSTLNAEEKEKKGKITMSICDSNAFVIGLQLHEFRILCDVFSAQNKQTLVKDDVHSGAHARTLFTF
jgi:hypothetical protein